MEHVGRSIRHHRARTGLTQEELAAKAEVSPVTVVRLEAGQIERPRNGTLQKIAGALGVEVEELRTGDGGPFTAWFEKGEQGWWVATCPEIPEAITQGRTVEEARKNLKDAIRMELEIRREEAEEDLEGREVIRERIAL